MVKRFSQFLRSFDKFGEPVKMLYKGEDTYKTKLGAILSLLLNTVVLVYLVKKGIALVTKSDSAIQVLEKYTSRSVDNNTYNFSDCQFKPFIVSTLSKDGKNFDEGLIRDVPEEYGSIFVQYADKTIHRPAPARSDSIISEYQNAKQKASIEKFVDYLLEPDQRKLSISADE